MAVIDHHNSESHGFSFTAPFTAVWNLLVRVAENDPRVRKAEALNRLSDDDLAARGLTRKDIAAHVFRDYMHL